MAKPVKALKLKSSKGKNAAIKSKGTTIKKAAATKLKKPLKAAPKAKAAKKEKPAKASKKELVGKKPTKSPVALVKAEKSNKPPIPLQNPAKLFMEFWNPKNDPFMTAIRAFFGAYSVPGTTDKQKSENAELILRKIEDHLRREAVPEPILLEWRERFDPQRIRQLSAIVAMKPRTTIRLNVLKADIKGFAASKTGEDLKVKRGRLSPFSFDVGADINPTEHPIFERGIFEIEDEASQFASLLVNARPGQRILDLCAREGDHSLGIAAMMKNKGSLFVYDSDPAKTKILKARADRAGLENYRIVTDGQIAEVKSLDAVLVDAPCSGNGLLGRRPEIKWRFKKDDLPKLQKVQAGLLREAARKLKLGGRVIYVTSSLNMSENEAQIEHFLKNSHNSFRLVPGSEYLKNYVLDFVKNFYGLEMDEDLMKSLTTYDPFIFLAPDQLGTNGLFAAVIERIRISN